MFKSQQMYMILLFAFPSITDTQKINTNNYTVLLNKCVNMTCVVALLHNAVVYCTAKYFYPSVLP